MMFWIYRLVNKYSLIFTSSSSFDGVFVIFSQNLIYFLLYFSSFGDLLHFVPSLKNLVDNIYTAC